MFLWLNVSALIKIAPNDVRLHLLSHSLWLRQSLPCSERICVRFLRYLLCISCLRFMQLLSTLRPYFFYISSLVWLVYISFVFFGHVFYISFLVWPCQFTSASSLYAMCFYISFLILCHVFYISFLLYAMCFTSVSSSFTTIIYISFLFVGHAITSVFCFFWPCGYVIFIVLGNVFRYVF